MTVRLWRLAPLLLVAALASGCVSSRTSPRGVIPLKHQAPLDARGAWVQVNSKDGARVQGELLAITVDSTIVLTTENRVRRLGRSEVQQIVVEAYRNRAWAEATWAGLGAASSVSHGLFFPLSMSVWAVGGGTSTLAQSAAGFLRFPGDLSWEALAGYARFPAGLPEGLDPNGLRFVWLPPE